MPAIRSETQLRPRSVAELFDVALESLRRDLAVVLAATLVVSAPLAACLLLLVYGVTTLGNVTVPYLLPLAALAALLTLARPLAQGAVALALAARIERGEAPRLREAVRVVLARAVPTIFAGVAFWAVALAGGIIYVFPGVIFSAWCALAVPAAALEGKGPFDAVRRSMRLLKGHAGRAVGVNLMTLGAFAMLALDIVFAVQGVLYAGRSFFGLRTAYWEAVLSPSNGIFTTAVLLLVYVALEPWRACALYHLHLDSRIRFEAFDIVRAIERVEEEAGQEEEAVGTTSSQLRAAALAAGAPAAGASPAGGGRA